MKEMMNKLTKIIFNKNERFLFMNRHGFFKSMDDKKIISKLYRIYFNKELDIDNPITINEKLQWLKIYDRKPIYVSMADKYAVKEYISNIIGKEFVIPTIGVYKRFEDIDFNILPNQFVIKTTHDSGGVVICKDKTLFDFKLAKEKINKSLKRDYYSLFREWPYKNIMPKIIIEKYMFNANEKVINDYKVYTFNGISKLMLIVTNRGEGTTKGDYFDTNFNHLKMTWGFPNSDIEVLKPKNFELMLDLAEKLAVNTYQLRVDFYEINEKVYVGELTFFDGAGFQKIEPNDYDIKLGSWIKLPI